MYVCRVNPSLYTSISKNTRYADRNASSLFSYRDIHIYILYILILTYYADADAGPFWLSLG